MDALDLFSGQKGSSERSASSRVNGELLSNYARYVVP